MIGRPPKHHRPNARQQGAGIPWLLGWVAGIAVLTLFCANRHVPALEQAMLSDVQAAVTPIATAPVIASVQGYVASLRGEVTSPEQGQALLNAAASVDGIREVNNQLIIVATTDSGAAGTDNEPPRDLATTTARANGTEDSQAPSISTDPSANQPPPGSAAAGSSETGANNTSEPNSDSATEIGPANTQTPSSSETPPGAPATESVTETTPVNEPVAPRPPVLQIAVDGKTLSISGRVPTQNALNDIVRASINAFDIDAVNNRALVDAETQSATWLNDLPGILPAFSAVEQPQIGFTAKRLVLAGRVESDAAHERLIERLEPLGLPLIDRMRVEEPSPEPEPEPEPEPSPEPSPEPEPEPEPEPAPAPAPAPASDSVETESAQGNDADYPTQRAQLQTAFDALPDTRILFEVDSNRLTADSQRILDSLASLFRQYPAVTVAIDGHTDAAGPEDLNLALSQQRANVVRDYLVRRGVSVYQLKSYGFGEGIPIADNSTAEGRARNRRIEFNF